MDIASVEDQGTFALHHVKHGQAIKFSSSQDLVTCGCLVSVCRLYIQCDGILREKVQLLEKLRNIEEEKSESKVSQRPLTRLAVRCLLSLSLVVCSR